MDDYQKLVSKALETVTGVMPWDLEDEINNNPDLIILDIREQDEFDMMHIKGSLHVPRGLLEGACCWNYDDTVPSLASSRNQDIVVICRSGNRSALAAQSMQQLGFTKVRSLKLGIKGWNDTDLELINADGYEVDIDEADEWLNTAVPEENIEPKKT